MANSVLDPDWKPDAKHHIPTRSDCGTTGDAISEKAENRWHM
jgi:hypothetical protein